MKGPGTETGRDESMEEGSLPLISVEHSKDRNWPALCNPGGRAKSKCRESKRIIFQLKNFLTELSNSAMGCPGRQ